MSTSSVMCKYLLKRRHKSKQHLTSSSSLASTLCFQNSSNRECMKSIVKILNEQKQLKLEIYILYSTT